MSNVTVLGCGSWGTALAIVLAGNGHAVTMWCRRAEQAEEMNGRRENSRYRSYMAILIALIAVFILVGGTFGYLGLQVYNHDGIYDGVTAAGVDLSGLSRHEASAALEAQMKSVLEHMTFNVVVDEDSWSTEKPPSSQAIPSWYSALKVI